MNTSMLNLKTRFSIKLHTYASDIFWISLLDYYICIYIYWLFQFLIVYCKLRWLLNFICKCGILQYLHNFILKYVCTLYILPCKPHRQTQYLRSHYEILIMIHIFIGRLLLYSTLLLLFGITPHIAKVPFMCIAAAA